MKEELYAWMRSLAVFYILLTTVLHLAPAPKYERYIRFFMGLLLILMLISPTSAILGKGGELRESFEKYYQQESSELENLETENLQFIYLEESYAAVLAEKILENLKETGISAAGADVQIEQGEWKVRLYFEKLPGWAERRQIADAVQKQWGIAEGNVSFKTLAPGA